MMRVVFCVFLAVCLCLTRGVDSLECYSCTDCGLSGIFSILETKTTCADLLGTGRCSKTVLPDGTVDRGCADAVTCAGTDLFAKCRSASDTNCRICCDTDTCNSASNIKVAWLAVLLPVAAAILAARF
ncbi:uncharacterized protein LOC110975384 [Acanthaster planci]|uniref:Uncharacterized protein LOC110975384 n=1 Tax=Acanthaster planci TaxID=133434 RepID=A0A8B7XRQ7_ACAPL|nr:uncharacterized protein LOC110975384 [Acanthaster planci]